MNIQVSGRNFMNKSRNSEVKNDRETLIKNVNMTK